jgi:divalent metal cation (Fe/Co/Zn/Cd) transporter
MKRAVRSIIRLAAAGLIVFGGMEIGLEFVRHRFQQVRISPWHCLIGAVLMALGITLLAFSARLAARLTEDFEE